jgi:hypothetical protein
MSLPRDLARAVRRLDEHQLRRLLILARGLLLRSDGPVVELDEIPGMPAVTYRQEHTRCGRDCGTCPHGPYWYAYWREGDRRRSLYIGSDLPGDVRRMLERQPASPRQD